MGVNQSKLFKKLDPDPQLGSIDPDPQIKIADPQPWC